MEALAFVIWMIGWPFVCWWSRINRHAVGIVDGSYALTIDAIFQFAIWLFVAFLIWTGM